jgi:hypothetical protein
MMSEYSQKPALVDQVTMVSNIWRKIHRDLETINEEVKNAFKAEDSKKSLQSKHTPIQPKNEAGKSKLLPQQKLSHSQLPIDNLISTIDKLFDERLTFIPQQLELKPPILMGSLTKTIIKSLIEFIRTQQYKEVEFHQIQVDVMYIRAHFWEYLDEKIINVLCDEAQVSAEYQCKIDAVPLDPLVIFD